MILSFAREIYLNGLFLLKIVIIVKFSFMILLKMILETTDFDLALHINTQIIKEKNKVPNRKALFQFVSKTILTRDRNSSYKITKLF